MIEKALKQRASWDRSVLVLQSVHDSYLLLHPPLFGERKSFCQRRFKPEGLLMLSACSSFVFYAKQKDASIKEFGLKLQHGQIQKCCPFKVLNVNNRHREPKQ